MRMRSFPIIALMVLGVAGPALAQSNWDTVGEALGKTGKLEAGDVYRVGIPRPDLGFTLDGVAIKPGLALGGWVAFKDMGANAMLMGDLVLAENEVNPVMKQLLQDGIQITGLHKHLIGAQTPMYMHIGGEGDAVAMAKAVKAALALSKTPFESAPAAKAPEISFDTGAVDQTLGAKGTDDGGIYKFSMPRAEPVSMHGMDIPPAMGTAIAINFQPLGDGQAATTGDFVMTANEVQPVLQAMTSNGISVMPLHNHMLEEEPRLFFVHFWGHGDVQQLAKGLRAALDKVAIAKGSAP